MAGSAGSQGVTAPGRSAHDLAAVVRDAHDRGGPLRVVGTGTWLAAGGAVRSDARPLDVSGLTGVVEYVPGDLTLTARAGTTLAEIDAATTPHGQWCPLLPWGSDDASIGAVFATATSGPFERAMGRPRDLALGLEFVDGTGAIIRAGGRVVKNVAGFDLTRLLVGSWGTLGVITEVSVRLRARPAVDETWIVELDRHDPQAREGLAAFERGPYAPLACSRIGEADARLSELASPAADGNAALIRIGGNATFVAASRDVIRRLGRCVATDPAAWTNHRSARKGDTRVNLERALNDPLSRRVKEKFDPKHILNPGIFGETVA
jgi:glycolate oxidase FAD binding subunit